MIDACTVLRHTCRTIVLRVVTALVDNRFFHITLKLLPSLMFGSHVSRNRNAQTNRHLRLVLIFCGVQTLRSRLSLAPPRARLQSPQAT
jgi:hypothetical protein